ncbi:MAG TPA: hypothetical protein VHD76_05390 [Bryobacteraceae bacterium]|nr:hypothetical protein [Bryobacteraceae bacterium]
MEPRPEAPTALDTGGVAEVAAEEDLELGTLPRRVPPNRDVAAWKAEEALGAEEDAAEVVPPAEDEADAPDALLEPDVPLVLGDDEEEEEEDEAAPEELRFRPLRLPLNRGASSE